MHRVVRRQDWSAPAAAGTTTSAWGGAPAATTTTQAAWSPTTTQWQAPSSSSQPAWSSQAEGGGGWSSSSSADNNQGWQSSSSQQWSAATTTTTSNDWWASTTTTTQAWTPSSSSTTEAWTPSTTTQAWSSSEPAWSSSSSTANWWDSTTTQASSSTSAWQSDSTSATPTSSASSAALESSAGPETFTSHSTSLVVVDASASATSDAGAANSLAAQANNVNGGSSNGLNTGAVAGIVVGAVVAIAAIIGGVFFILKKKMRDHDPNMVSPFERDAWRRASVMLDDDHPGMDDDDEYGTESYRKAAATAGYSSHSPHMSEYSMQTMMMGAGAAGAGAGAGAAGLVSHPHAHMHAGQPGPVSFGPAQGEPIMPPPAAYAVPGYVPYPEQPNGVDSAGALGAYPSLDRGPSQVSRNGRGLSVPPVDLSRRDSQASAYSQYSDGPDGLAIPPLAAGGAYESHMARGGPAYGYTDERGLPLVHEVEEPYTPPSATNGRFADLHQRLSPDHHEGNEMYPERSGTPENANVQQTFFSSREEQFGDADSLRDGAHVAAFPFDGHVAQIGRSWSAEAGDDGAGLGSSGSGEFGASSATATGGASGAAPGAAGHRRRLSVRNGGLDDFVEEDDEGVRQAAR
ncbi:hypothetical protein JCM8202_004342 [Rhodotorula sphaerocarpa]